MRGSIGWLKRRNFASSGQSLLRDKQDQRSYRVCRATNRKIGGLPIGVKLEGRLRIPSAILGGGGIEIRSRGPSRDPSGRRAQTGQSRKAFSDAGPRVRILLPPPVSLSHRCLPRRQAQRPGFRREGEPGRDQRAGRAGHDPARLDPFSLTGTDAVPPRESRRATRRAQALPGHTLSRVARQLSRRLRCSVQSSGRSSSVRRVAVSSTGCRPCRIASTSSGLRKARSTRRRT